jgi:hypothetical protein
MLAYGLAFVLFPAVFAAAFWWTWNARTPRFLMVPPYGYCHLILPPFAVASAIFALLAIFWHAPGILAIALSVLGLSYGLYCGMCSHFGSYDWLTDLLIRRKKINEK